MGEKHMILFEAVKKGDLLALDEKKRVGDGQGLGTGGTMKKRPLWSQKGQKTQEEMLRLKHEKP